MHFIRLMLLEKKNQAPRWAFLAPVWFGVIPTGLECRVSSCRRWGSRVPSFCLSLWNTSQCGSNQNAMLSGQDFAFWGPSDGVYWSAGCALAGNLCVLSVQPCCIENNPICIIVVWKVKLELTGLFWEFASLCKAHDGIMAHHRGTQATAMWLSPCLGG